MYGAYTELFAGLSPKVTLKNSGAWSTSKVHFALRHADMAIFSHPLGPLQ